MNGCVYAYCSSLGITVIGAFPADDSSPVNMYPCETTLLKGASNLFGQAAASLKTSVCENESGAAAAGDGFEKGYEHWEEYP